MKSASVIFCVSIDNTLHCKFILSLHGLEIRENSREIDINGTLNSNNVLNESKLKECSGNDGWIRTNIIYLKPFIDKLISSKSCRKKIISYCRKNSEVNCDSYTPSDVLLNNNIDTLVLSVYSKDSYVIDYAWGRRLWRQCHMGLERDCAAAWLSTLGGAFSALGDYSDQCAKMALRISMQQIRLSLMCSDPDGVARGWLFLSLALSQLGHGRAAFSLLHAAYSVPSYDPRHRCMCLGVQAKLKYDRKLRRLRRLEGNYASGDSLQHTLRMIVL